MNSIINSLMNQPDVRSMQQADVKLPVNYNRPVTNNPLIHHPFTSGWRTFEGKDFGWQPCQPGMNLLDYVTGEVEDNQIPLQSFADACIALALSEDRKIIPNDLRHGRLFFLGSIWEVFGRKPWCAYLVHQAGKWLYATANMNEIACGPYDVIVRIGKV